MIYFFGVVATLIMMIGQEGRGSWSQNISIVGGLLWLGSIVFAFYSTNWKTGLLFILGTLIFGAILKKLLRPILNKRGLPDHRY
jgi:hypothetical protein